MQRQLASRREIACRCSFRTSYVCSPQRWVSTLKRDAMSMWRSLLCSVCSASVLSASFVSVTASRKESPSRAYLVDHEIPVAIVRIYRHQSKVALGQIRPMPATGGAGKGGSAGPSRAGTSAGGLGPDSAGDPVSAPTAGATGAAAGRKPSLKNPDAPTSASAAASRKASLANPDAPLADAAGAADETADPGNALRAGSRKPTAKI